MQKITGMHVLTQLTRAAQRSLSMMISKGIIPIQQLNVRGSSCSVYLFNLECQPNWRYWHLRR